jgi:hypothetical protein
MHKLKYNKDPRETRLEDLPGPKSKEELDEMKMPYEDYCKAKFDPGNEFGKPQSLKGIRWMSTTITSLRLIPSATWLSSGPR